MASHLDLALKFFSRLEFKLFILIFTILLVGFAGILWINIGIHHSRLEAGKIDDARSSADLIKNAIHDSMLMNQSQEISTIIANIGRGEGIDGIRIYNKRSEIIYSSRIEERGLTVNSAVEASCIPCHGPGTPMETPPAGRFHRIYAAPDGQRILGYISPIRNDPTCSGAACHAHPESTTMLGLLDVRLSLAKMDNAIAASTQGMLLWAAGIILLAALASGAFIRILIHRPMTLLFQGTGEIARGNLAFRIGSRSRDEIGLLARSFDAMAGDLQKAREEITSWSSTLEARVREKTADLERAQARMVQVEKMASLGKLSATVAHELNNPLAGILTYAKVIIRRLTNHPGNPDKVKESVEEIRIIEGEARRCGNIINNLLVFAKGGKGEVQEAGIRQIVERAFAVVRHHMEIRGVKMEAEGPEGSDSLRCDPDQILEVLVALFINAAEAMPAGGSLAVRARREGASMRIDVSDSGCGIPAEAIPHIFEPFFTTKKEGKALGLGLSVVYGIIQSHGGRISVESKPGAGTTFRIILPMAAAVPEDAGPMPAAPSGPPIKPESA